jgi:D-inositol-3-phosphate glycosyltransferase
MDRPLRIAFLSEHASPIALLGGPDAGGQNVYVDEVSRNLAQRGYVVDVFTRRDSRDMPDVITWAPGVRIVHLPAGPARFLPKDKLWPFMPAFRDAFLRFTACDTSFYSIGANSARNRRRRSLPAPRYDLIHGNFWMSGWVATELRRQLHVPAVQIFHALGKTKRRHQGAADTSPAERIDIELGIVRCADALIAQCPAEAHELIEDYGAGPDKITLIPSAVNTRRFQPVARDEARRRIGLTTDGMVIVYVGRMLPRKDVRNIVRALALLTQRSTPDASGPSSGSPLWHQESAATAVTLLIVGGETAEPDPIATPEIGALQRLAAELGIADRVIFAGKRQPDTLRYYYGAGDVVVTTPWYEPFGLTPLEAMACGRPVIGSAVGGLTYTIQDGKTGFLVPPRNPEALAERLHLLLTQPALRTRMGRTARARVEREFIWPLVAGRTAALYQTLLSQQHAREAPLTAPFTVPNSESLGV